MTFDCIVVGSHLRFDGVRQRPQHIATRLARRAPLLFVEEPFRAAADADEFTAYADVTVLRPKRREVGEERLDARTIAAVRAWLRGRRALLWLYTPMMLPLADAFGEAALVFDCMDDLAAFAFAPAALRERERALLERSTLVFAGGRSLYERRRAFGEKVRLYPSGVEFEHFAGAGDRAPHPLFTHLPHPLCAYMGVIDERVDFDAVAALADRGAQVALVGPFSKIDPAILPRRTDVHFTGAMPYADLPALLAGCDVAIMPFALNEATASISPTKTPEYLAAGKPVVSTPIADVVAAYGDVVHVAKGPAAFAEACLEAACTADEDRIERGRQRARAAGWDALVARMLREVERE